MAQQSGTQTITSTSDQQKSVPVVTVESFYNSHAEQLLMKLDGPRVGFHRKIREPTINRPGLALSGFYTYFAEKRVQVLGAEKPGSKSPRAAVSGVVCPQNSMPRRLARIPSRSATACGCSRRENRGVPHADDYNEVY